MNWSVANNQRSVNRKGPTKLVLKKSIRRSSIYDSMPRTCKNEKIVARRSSSSIISATTSSSSYASCKSKEKPADLTDSIEVVPDSDVDDAELIEEFPDKSLSLDEDKFRDIKNWVLNVNEAGKLDGCNNTRFSDVSVILPENQKPKTVNFKEEHAANSTFLDGKAISHFDQFFTKKSDNYNRRLEDVRESNSVIVIDSDDDSKKNDRLINEFHSKTQINNESCIMATPSSEKKSSADNSLAGKEENDDVCSVLSSDTCLSEETGQILDDIYRPVWRKNKQLLSRSAKRKRMMMMSKQELAELKFNEPKSPFIAEKKSPTLVSPIATNKEQKTDAASSSSSDVSDIIRVPSNLMRKRLIFFNSSDDDGDDDEEENNRNKVNVPVGEIEQKETECSNVNSKVILKNKTSKLPIPENKMKNSSKERRTYGDVWKEENYSVQEHFLTSLSNTVQSHKGNAEALKYKQNYKKLRDELAKKLFGLFNESVFDGAIPESTVIEWSPRMTKSGGYCVCKRKTHRDGRIERFVNIKLSTKVLSSSDRLRDTLLHEMCHAAVWIVNEVSDGHGYYWQNWAQKAMIRYPNIPKVTRCHNYSITTKYTYQCVNCKYSVGRHSKSLDIERYRCGLCHGRFEILLNKVSKRGSLHPVPATPKGEVKGFARFVKENYSQYKSPLLKNSDVMKILGKKFKEMKVDV